MKKVLIITALFLLSATLFMSMALSGTSGTTSSFEQSDILTDSTSQTSTQEDNSVTTSLETSSQEISSQENSSEKPSSKETSSEVISSKETSSKETSSEETSSEKVSSKETSSEITSSAVTSSQEITETVTPTYNETRAIWISYLELNSMLAGGNKAAFVNNFKTACENVKNLNLNTVIVHVRPFSDALYKSDYFPWSHIINGVQGTNPGFDPLEEMVKIAHNAGLKIEAWINPYRIRTSNMALSNDNPAVKWAASDYVVSVGNNKYYNPAYSEVQDLIVNGVVEIVRNYDVDGIHFDDYFYPDPDEDFDKLAYQTLGNGQTLGDFRRNNVTTLIRKVYNAVKNVNPSVTFGISPQGNNTINYNQQYVDVKTIVRNGYIDYLCPQIYYGFEHGLSPFDKTVEEFNGYVKGTNVKLYVGMAAYKIGNVDNWAGSGKNEWLTTTDILKRQVLETRKNNNCKGFFLYTYSSFFSSSLSEQMKTEIQNLKSILK